MATGEVCVSTGMEQRKTDWGETILLMLLLFFFTWEMAILHINLPSLLNIQMDKIPKMPAV